MKRLLTLGTLMCVFALTAGPVGAAQQLNSYSLQGDFMCVSCHEPLNQVSSPEAENEKVTLAKLVDSGLNLNQIKARMVEDYSEAVLAEPPAHGIGLLVYILPPVVLVAGLGLLAYNLPRWRRSQARQSAVAGPTGPPPDRQSAERLNRELAEFDR